MRFGNPKVWLDILADSAAGASERTPSQQR